MMKFLVVLVALLAISSTVKAQDCGTCELVMNFIEGWVESNATETQILNYLETICGLFPSYTTTCDAIASQGISQIIAYINANETPEEICTQMGLCSSSKSTKPSKIVVPNFDDLRKIKIPTPAMKKPAAKVGDVQCSGCEEVISIIENWLNQSSSQSEVVSAVEIVCTYMPGWEATCDAMVAMGVPTAVSWIDTYENPTVVCGQLGLCSSSKKQKPVKHFTDDCGECGEVITLIENYVASNTSIAVIENYVNVACTFVPQWTSMCEMYIDGEIPQIVQWIEQDASPTTICTDIGLCSSNKVSIN